VKALRPLGGTLKTAKNQKLTHYTHTGSWTNITERVSEKCRRKCALGELGQRSPRIARAIKAKHIAAVAHVTQTQYTACMKTAVIPQIRVEPELRADLESVLKRGETLTEFVEATVRNAIAYRRMQTEFHARAQAASEQYHQTGVSVPVDAVLDRLQAKLDAKRKKLGR
jgi:hypothetical protein